VTIHTDHPFLDPEGDRDPVRRLRGRLGGVVTLWASGAGQARAGLTVSSLMVAAGEPGRLLALVDPDSDLADTVRDTGRVVVSLLRWPQRDLAEMFAGSMPAPGGGFAQEAFTDTVWGPRPESATTWAGARLEDAREVGWSLLLTAVLEHVELGDETDPLLHRRGRYVPPT
jgi:flavin reductase (DIM6/NTAB) family NADH-FMN oxidoreductase RutF